MSKTKPKTLDRTDSRTSQAPAPAAEALAVVRAQLMTLGLPVLDVQGRFSRSNGALMLLITIAKAYNQRYLSAVELTIVRTVNSQVAADWKTQVYWRYQLPVHTLQPSESELEAPIRLN